MIFCTSEPETSLPLKDSFLRALTSLIRSVRANTQKSIPAIDYGKLLFVSSDAGSVSTDRWVNDVGHAQ